MSRVRGGAMRSARREPGPSTGGARLGRGRRALAMALAAALVALVALSTGGTALAAPHHKRPSHPTHAAHTTRPSKPAFALDFTCAQGWNHVTAVVCVKTVVGAALTIRVTECGRAVHDPGLAGVAHTDDKGQYAWSWTPNTTCKTAKATVTATSGGKTVTKSTAFAITPEPGV